jgi:hypothetical protein
VDERDEKRRKMQRPSPSTSFHFIGPSGLLLQMEQSGRGGTANGEIAALATRPAILMSGITVCTFELPTTGSLSFADHFSNGLDVYTAHVSDATQARANLRAVLKESKHTDGDKDYLRLVKARLISDLQQNGHSYPASASRR